MEADGQIELTEAPVGAGGGRRRLSLWGVLAVTAVVVGALVVASAGDDGTSAAPKLPIALGGQGGVGAEAAMAADASFAGPVTYVPADDLPALGGSGSAYRLLPATDADVARVAGALGLDGDAQRTDIGWELLTDEGTLTVPFPGGSWWYQSGELLSSGGGGSTGAAECVVDESGQERCSTSLESGCVEPVEPGVAPGGPGTESVPCPDQPVAADLPEGDPIPVAEAESIARDLYASAGGPFEVVRVDVMESSPSRVVTVSVALEGIPVEGVGLSLSIDPSGTILDASGVAGSIEEVGSYDLLDTRAALERLNEDLGGSVGIGPAPMPMPAEESEPGVDCPEGYEPAACGDVDCRPVPLTTPPPATSQETATTVVDPDASVSSGSAAVAEPAPDCPPVTTVPPEPLEPVEVLVTGADRILLVTPSHDGNELYLVPGYRFTAEDGSQPVVAAVVDDAVAGPDTTPVETEPPQPVDECHAQPGSGEARTQTSEHNCPPDSIPTTTTTTAERVEFDVVAPLYHCGIEPVVVDQFPDLRWIADPPPFDATNAPPEYVGRGGLSTGAFPEIGAERLYIDSSGIEVPMVAVGPDWEPPPCD